MNVIDSSGWLEYLADGANADFFAGAIEDSAELIVPSISIYEVFKRVAQQRDERVALQAVAAMQHGTVVDLDVTLALEAARLSMALKIPMADSIILATTQTWNAVLWTQDEHFQGLPEVQYVAKGK
jgi:predicted nucleic acid-binding protein